MQITVPNEFQPIGKFNIGVTAGIETTVCAPEWIDGMIESVLEYLKNCNIIKPNFKNFSKVFDINNITKRNSGLWGEGVFGIRRADFLKINGFENWRCAADTDFMIRAEKYGFKIKRSDNLMFYRRLHEKGLTSAKETGYNSYLRVHYTKLIKNRKNFNPLPNLFVSEVSMVVMGSENKNLYGIDQNINNLEIEKHKVVNLIEWWRKKACQRYETLYNESRLKTELEMLMLFVRLDAMR